MNTSLCYCFFFFKQKTAYEMRISDWSSDVCSSDLAEQPHHLARGLVRSVIKPAEDVDIDHDEEHRRAGGVRIAQQPARIDVAHDVLDREKGDVRIGGIMHRQHDAGDDLDLRNAEAEAAEDRARLQSGTTTAGVNPVIA